MTFAGHTACGRTPPICQVQRKPTRSPSCLPEQANYAILDTAGLPSPTCEFSRTPLYHPARPRSGAHVQSLSHQHSPSDHLELSGDQFEVPPTRHVPSLSSTVQPPATGQCNLSILPRNHQPSLASTPDDPLPTSQDLRISEYASDLNRSLDHTKVSPTVLCQNPCSIQQPSPYVHTLVVLEPFDLGRLPKLSQHLVKSC